MPSFKDNADREWLVVVNVNQVRRVREIGVNLADVDDQNLLSQLADPVTLIGVLFTLCEEQATRDSVSAEQFGKAMYGDAIGEATLALGGALADFSQEPKRTMWRMAIERVRRDKGRMEKLLIDKRSEIERIADGETESQNPSGDTSSPSLDA